MKNPKLRILTYLLAAAGLLLAAVIYPRLPQEIPTHWDLDGTVTYSGRHMIFSPPARVFLWQCFLTCSRRSIRAGRTIRNSADTMISSVFSWRSFCWP